MRIAFFGSSLVSAFRNGAATYYRGIIRALADRGHSVTFYEPDAGGRQVHRDLENPSWARVAVYEPDEGAVRRALEDAARADLVVKASGVGVFDDLLEAAVPELKSSVSSVVFWDVDAPATLERLRENPRDPFHELIPRYDAILTYGGGQTVVDQYCGFGARHCVPVYNALDPLTHYPVEPDPRFMGNLGFLGNRMPDREQRVDEFFFRPANLLPDAGFVLGGAGWQDKPRPPNVSYSGHICPRDHNAFHCSSRAVVNISRESMARYGYSPASRVFEAAGASCCIITDSWEGIEMFLEPGREVLVASSGDEVADHIRGLTPADAIRIGSAARRRIAAQHTYRHRAEQVEQVLDSRIRVAGGIR
jgi:spore maturation protein CgeB